MLPVKAQSVSIQGGIPYYFFDGQKSDPYIAITNNFNYSYFLSAVKYIHNCKVQIGMGRQSKKYTMRYNTDESSLIKEKATIDNLIFPLQVDIKVAQINEYVLSILTGNTFIRPYNYSKLEVANSGNNLFTDNIQVYYKTGSVFKLGTSISRTYSNRLVCSVFICGGVKWDKDYFETHPKSYFSELRKDLFDLHLGMSLEYVFKKRPLKFFSRQPINSN
jgi:hypothetical protein